MNWGEGCPFSYYVFICIYLKFFKSAVKNFFLLKYIWITVLCQFLLYSKATQSYIYIHSFSHIIFHHVPSQVIGYKIVIVKCRYFLLCRPEGSSMIYLTWWKEKKTSNQDYFTQQGSHSDLKEKSKALQKTSFTIST